MAKSGAAMMETPIDATRQVWYAPNKFEAYGEEEIEAVTQCLRDGWLAGFGPKTQQFEREVATIFGKKFGLFVCSGSAACLLALAALDLPAGSEVITPACTFSTTVAPMVQLGLKPVFCDVERTTYVASVDALVAVVTPNTKVIMAPNLVGNLVDWKALKARLAAMERSDIILIEDSADTIYHCPDSDVSTTSFYASHIITAGGSGGMVMFNDEKYVKRATMFRDWGRIGTNAEAVGDRFGHMVDGIPYDFKFLYGCLGYNFKSSEMNAAFGLVQLRKFDANRTKRRENVRRYMERLKDVHPDLILPDDSKDPNWLAFPLQYKDRMALLDYLESNGVQTRVCFAGNITRHPAYREFCGAFENADTIMAQGFLLGAHHGMDTAKVDIVCDLIIKFFADKK